MSDLDPSVSSRNGDAPQSLDTEVLISEIKKHPVLYKRAQTEYLEKLEKQKDWIEICQNIFKHWNKFCPRKKRDKVKEVQNKWLKLKQSFLKSYTGAQKLSPLIKKKNEQLFEKMSFLIPTPVVQDVDMGVNNNNDDTFEFGMEALSSEKTRDDVMQSTSASIANFAKTYEVKKEPFIIQIPKIEQPPQDPIDENMHFALMMVPLLRKLNSEQRYYAWPNIIEVLQKAEEIGKNKLCVLQDELRYPVAADPNMLQDLNYPIPEPEAETETVLETEPIFPASHGRPTNEQGEIDYPVTDNEDLDEP